jgi:Major royal jelly protein
MRLVLGVLLLLSSSSPSLVAAAAASSPSAQLLYSWQQVVYDFSTCSYCASQPPGFNIPANNAITGIKYYANDLYLTVPRWRTGVPSTLNKVVQVDGRAVLQAWPSWDFVNVANPSGVRYVQSMEIDTSGRMWILDVGRLNIFDAPDVARVNGPAKLIIMDIASASVLREFIFPDSVAPWDSSFCNDLVVDEVNMFAYISDAGAEGAIIVYDYTANVARRFSDPTMQSENIPMKIQGLTYDIFVNLDGIALTSDAQTLYYCALDGLHMYRVPTGPLREFATSQTTSVAFLSTQVVQMGVKDSFSDGACARTVDGGVLRARV